MGCITYLPKAAQSVVAATATPNPATLNTLMKNGTTLLNTPTLLEVGEQGAEYLKEQIRLGVYEGFTKPMQEAIKNCLINAWHSFVEISFGVSVLASVLGIIFMLGGIEKGKKIVFVAVVTYTCIKIVEISIGI